VTTHLAGDKHRASFVRCEHVLYGYIFAHLALRRACSRPHQAAMICYLPSHRYSGGDAAMA